MNKFVLITLVINRNDTTTTMHFLYKYPTMDWDLWIKARKEQYNYIWGENHWHYNGVDILHLSEE